MRFLVNHQLLEPFMPPLLPGRIDPILSRRAAA